MATCPGPRVVVGEAHEDVPVGRAHAVPWLHEEDPAGRCGLTRLGAEAGRRAAGGGRKCHLALPSVRGLGRGEGAALGAGRLSRRALRVCPEPGCPVVTAGEPCLEHAPEALPEARGSAASRGYTKRWTRYSLGYRREHPWCRHCEAKGRKTPTAIVDHTEPVTGPGDPLFWDPKNHQPLCRSCHGVKTAREGRTQGKALERAPTSTRKRWLA